MLKYKTGSGAGCDRVHVSGGRRNSLLCVRKSFYPSSSYRIAIAPPPPGVSSAILPCSMSHEYFSTAFGLCHPDRVPGVHHSLAQRFQFLPPTLAGGGAIVVRHLQLVVDSALWKN